MTSYISLAHLFSSGKDAPPNSYNFCIIIMRGKGSTFTCLLQAPQILGLSQCYPETTRGSPEKHGLGISTCIIGLSVNSLAIHFMHQTTFLACCQCLKSL